MYRVTLVIDRIKGENDFETRRQAQEIVTGLQQLFDRDGFRFVAYDRFTNFYLYLRDEDDVRGRVGLFIVPDTREKDEPFLRVRKKK